MYVCPSTCIYIDVLTILELHTYIVIICYYASRAGDAPEHKAKLVVVIVGFVIAVDAIASLAIACPLVVFPCIMSCSSICSYISV